MTKDSLLIKQRVCVSTICTMVLKYSSQIGKPSICYALTVMTFHLITSTLIAVNIMKVGLNTFNENGFLMISLVMCGKEVLSFVSSPIIGALSDVWGRKSFMFITVLFTCALIPFMQINLWCFFVMVSISGILFDVTFSLIFTYVADVTTTAGRSMAFGCVSAALVVIDTGIEGLVHPMVTHHHHHGYGNHSLIIVLATVIAVLNAIFIYFVVPESLPENVRPVGTSSGLKYAHPFSAIKKVGLDRTILLQCVALLLSYIPEAGKLAILFIYLKVNKGYTMLEVAYLMTAINGFGILVLLLLGIFTRLIGHKRTIILGLGFVAIQLLLFGIGSQLWIIWVAAILSALGSITYPAILAFVSVNSHANSQGVALGIINGTRGLCKGLGPLMFNVLLTLFNKKENENVNENEYVDDTDDSRGIPGWIIASSAILVLIAILVECFIPAKPKLVRRASEISSNVHYERETGREADSTTLSPLV